MRHIHNAGIRRWVEIKDASETHHGYEITYWTKGGRTILFLCFNPELQGTAEGEGHAKNLKTKTVPITLQFKTAIQDIRNERTGKRLADSKSVTLNWTINEAFVLSFRKRTD